MRTHLVSLAALFVCILPVLAAPAPFAKPAPADSVVVERLKAHLKRYNGFDADQISPGSQPNEWIVVGHAPVAGDEGQLNYLQSYFHVTSSLDKRGGSTFAVVPMIRPRRAITK